MAKVQNNRTITINQLTMGGRAIYGVKAFVSGPNPNAAFGHECSEPLRQVQRRHRWPSVGARDSRFLPGEPVR